MSFDMGQIRRSMMSELQKLGYNASIKKLTNFNFEMIGRYDLSGAMVVTSANAKRFEVKVVSKESDFNISCRRDFSTRMSYFAVRRFTKKPEAVLAALKWVATAVKSHTHLDQLMHLDRELSEPFGFASGTYMRDNCGAMFYGMINKVVIKDIVTINGSLITHGAYIAGLKPYFLVQVDLRTRSYPDYGRDFTFVTDGDVWYPVMKCDEKYVVFMDKKQIERLAAMNQNDKELIFTAAQAYIEELLKEERGV